MPNGGVLAIRHTITTRCPFSSGDGWQKPLGEFPGGLTRHPQRVMANDCWNSLPESMVGFPAFKVFTCGRRGFFLLSNRYGSRRPPPKATPRPRPPRPRGRAGRRCRRCWSAPACRSSATFRPLPAAPARARFPGARPVIKLTPPFGCGNCMGRSVQGRVPSSRSPSPPPLYSIVLFSFPLSKLASPRLCTPGAWIPAASARRPSPEKLRARLTHPLG